MKTIIAVVVAVVTSLSGPAFGQAFTDHETTAANESGTPGAVTHTGQFNETSKGVISRGHNAIADPTGGGAFSEVGVSNSIAGKDIYAGENPRSGSGVQPK